MEHKFSKIRSSLIAHRSSLPMNQGHAAGKYIFLRPFCARFSSFSFRPSCSAAPLPGIVGPVQEQQAPQAPEPPEQQAPQASEPPEQQAPQASEPPEQQAPQAPQPPEQQAPQAPQPPEQQAPQAPQPPEPPEQQAVEAAQATRRMLPPVVPSRACQRSIPSPLRFRIQQMTYPCP